METITALLLLANGVALYFWYRARRPEPSPYREGDPRYLREFSVSRKDTNYTLSNFTSCHRLELLCRRVNNEDFNLHKMLEPSSQNMLAMSFNTNRVRRKMYINSWYFHYELASTANGDNAPRLVTREYAVKGDKVLVREVSNKELIKEVNKEGFRHGGCEAELISIEPEILSEGIIEGNFDMLKEEHLNAVLRDERYGQYEELVAVAALKRRLEFLANKRDSYEADAFSIETDRAGRGLRIKWSLKSGANKQHELVGLRRTEGFHANQYDMSGNGTLVVHSNKNGETVELLKEGEAHFYTFFMKPYQDDRGYVPYSPLRFQVTIACKEETDAISGAIERLERLNADSPSQDVSRALKELGLYAEFDDAIGRREKKMVREIESAGYDAEEKEEKLSRLRDVVAAVRDKYQQ